jgi:hypothetical protein
VLSSALYVFTQSTRHNLLLSHRLEQNGESFRSRTTGSTDSVHVVFGVEGEFVVDHRRECLDVEATCRNIGGDHHARLAGLECSKGTVALLLVLVSVNLYHGVSVAMQEVAEAIRLNLAVYEDERLTYAQSHARVNAVASWLMAQGVKPGDRVAVAMRNNPELMLIYWACVSIGVAVVIYGGGALVLRLRGADDIGDKLRRKLLRR